jgi:hypothetical protein
LIPEELNVSLISFLGEGVFTGKRFCKGDFLLEYVGERIHPHEAVTRQKKGNNFLFVFIYNGKEQW